RTFVIYEAFRRGMTVDEQCHLTKYARFFLEKLKNLVQFDMEIRENRFSKEIVQKSKELGVADAQIARLWDVSLDEVYEFRVKEQVTPVYKMVDTCAAEFESETPYFYSTYEEENESIVSDRKKILVLGSGPIRIGQGIEFDYATVHSVLAIKEMGY
ncbi:hypothetical protein BLX88_26495, partial [Bacillus obstructivus]